MRIIRVGHCFVKMVMLKESRFAKYIREKVSCFKIARLYWRFSHSCRISNGLIARQKAPVSRLAPCKCATYDGSAQMKIR